MLHSIVLGLVLSLTFGHFVQNKNTAPEKESAADCAELEGVYEFISETTVLTKPDKITGERTQSDWNGIWQFQKCYYTRVMMKKWRGGFFDRQNVENLGFESFAGPYKTKGNRVQLIQTYALHPFDVERSTIMEYQVNGSTLTLTQTLTPYLENPSQGTVTIVLRRLK